MLFTTHFKSIWGYAFMFALACGESDYYRAAVLEHVRFSNMSLSSKEILQKNLKVYEIAAQTASLNDADIIVFPEWGLYPYSEQNRSILHNIAEDIPNPKSKVVNPCNEKKRFYDRTILQQLSCFARKNHIFLVANMVDKKVCKHSESCDISNIDFCKANQCPSDGSYFYNTNVVFNREGILIAKYYKRHLYFEHSLNEPQLPENVYFETDFGNFTTFICFDISFHESVEAVTQSNILNIAYPTHWFDHVPFALATPFQQSWAIVNQVNLLAANVHNPGAGTLGSGIYSASRGALIYSHNPDGHSKLLISNVPKLPSQNCKNVVSLNPKRFVVDGTIITEIPDESDKNFKRICNINVLGKSENTLKDYRCLPSNLTNFRFHKLKEKESKIELCSGEICCFLSYQVDYIDEDYFFGVSGSDLKFYEAFSFGVEACFLACCKSLNGYPCRNYLVYSQTVFQHVEIRGNFSTKYVYPFVVNSGIQLVKTDEWSYNGNSIIYDGSNQNSSLLFIGLYGRQYKKDARKLV